MSSPHAALEHIIAHGNRPASWGTRYLLPSWFRTGDGSELSVIAGYGTYCEPDADDGYTGPYSAVEVWLPGEEEPRTIAVDELRAWIDAHGGLVAGPAMRPQELPCSEGET